MKLLITAMVFVNLLNHTTVRAENNHAKPADNVNKENYEITVYRSPSCSCCGKWLTHLKAHDFIVIDQPNNAMQVIKDKYGINTQLASCHTAVVNGKIIEGHVPATDIKRLLTVNNPKIKGLTVPGMIVGTPGMEMGTQSDAYNVLAFDAEGKTHTYNAYKGH